MATIAHDDQSAAGAPAAARRPTRVALVGLALALLLGTTPFTHWIVPGEALTSQILREGVWWLAAAGLIAWLVRVERLSLASIGVRWTGWRSMAIGVGAGVALIAIQVLHFTVIAPALGVDPAAALARRSSIMALPIGFRVAMVLRAAVVEEVLFRGYLIEKGRQLTGRLWMGVALSVLTFTYAHLAGWGAVHLIPVFAGAALLAGLYAWRRDLVSNMLAHFIVDAVGFLLA